MGAETIALLIKWGPLALVGIVFLYYFINGLIKGTYKVLRRLGYVFLFVLFSWIFIDQITGFILDINISGDENIRGMLVELIEGNEDVNIFLGYAPELKTLLVDNPEIILSPIVFIVLLLVVLPLSFPVYWIYLIIWNLIAKYVFKRQKYQKDDNGQILRNEKGKKIKVDRKKRRLLGGLVYGVQGVFLISVILLPVNFVNRIYNRAKEAAQLDEGESLCSSIEFAELNEDICGFLDTYNETIFAKIGGEKSLDKMVNDSLTTVKINKEKVNLENELSSIAVSAVLLNESGLLKLLIDGVNLDTLDLSVIDFEKINKALDALFESYTLQKLSEAGVNYVLNEVVNDKLVEVLKDDNIVSKLEYEGYEQIRDELKSVINIIKYAVDNNMDKAITNNKDNVIGIVNNVSEENVEALVNKLLSLRIISNAMPSVLKAYAEEYGVNVPESMTSELNNEIANNIGNAVKFVQTMGATKIEDISEGNIVDNLSNLLFENGVLKTNSKDSLATLLHDFNRSYLFKDLVPTTVNKLLEDKNYKIDARVLKYVDSKEAWMKELAVLEKGFDIYSDYDESETIYYEKVTNLLNEIGGTKVMISILPFAYDELLPEIGLEIDSSNFPSIDFGEETEDSSKEEFYNTWGEELTLLKNISDSFGELQLQSLDDITVDLLDDEDNVEALSTVMGEVYKSNMLKEPFVDFMKDTMNEFVVDYEVEFTKEELLKIDTKEKWNSEFTNINEVLNIDFNDENNINSTNLKTVFDAVGDMELFKTKKVKILKFAIESGNFLTQEEFDSISWPNESDQNAVDLFWENETDVLLKVVDKKDTIETLSSINFDAMNTEEVGDLIDTVMESEILSSIVVDKMIDAFTQEDIRDDRDEGTSTTNLEESIRGVSKWQDELDIVKSMMNITEANFNEEVSAGVTRVEQMFIDIENSDLLSNMRANIMIKAVTLLNMEEANMSELSVNALKKEQSGKAYYQYDKEVDVIVGVSQNKTLFDNFATMELKEIDTSSVGGLLDSVMDSIIFDDYAVKEMIKVFTGENIRDDRDEGTSTTKLEESIRGVSKWQDELDIVKSMMNITESNFNEEVSAGVTKVEKMFDDIESSDLLSNMRANIMIKAVTLLNMEEANMSELSVNALKKEQSGKAYYQYDKEVSVIVNVSKNKTLFDNFATMELKTVDTSSVGGLLDSVMDSIIFDDYAVREMIKVFTGENIRDDRDEGTSTTKLEESIRGVSKWQDELDIVKSMMNITETNFNEEISAGVTRVEQMFIDIEESPLLTNMRANVLIKAVTLLNIDGVNTKYVTVKSLSDIKESEPYYQYNREIDVIITFADNKDDINDLIDTDISSLNVDDRDTIADLLDSIKLSDILKDKYIELLDGDGDANPGALGAIRNNTNLTSYGVSIKTRADTNDYRAISWKIELNNLSVISTNIATLKSYNENTINKETGEDKVIEIAGIIGSTLDAVSNSQMLSDNADQVIANKVIAQLTDNKVTSISKGESTWEAEFSKAIKAYIEILKLIP